MVCWISRRTFAACPGATEMKSSISRIRMAIASFSSASSRAARAASPGCEFLAARDSLDKEEATMKKSQVQLEKNMMIRETIPKIIMGRVKAKPLRSQ